MTSADEHLADLDRALHWRRRAEQLRRLDNELALWLGRLASDQTGVAAAVVGGLTARRRLVMAGQQKQRKAVATMQRRQARQAERV
jgi:hypothetical protein